MQLANTPAFTTRRKELANHLQTLNNIETYTINNKHNLNHDQLEALQFTHNITRNHINQELLNINYLMEQNKPKPKTT